MAAVTTTHAVSNYEGLLYNTTPEDTPLLAMLGGLYGGEPIGSIHIPWQEHDLRSPDQRVAVEGADAPTPTYATRSPVHNVLQIIHETVDASYTKQATNRVLNAIGANHPNVASTGASNPVVDELSWQEIVRIKEIARDVEYSLIQGQFADPGNNSSERQTRGIEQATSTNVVDMGTTIATSTDVTGTAADEDIDVTAHGLSDGDEVYFTALTGGAGLELYRRYYVINSTTDDFNVSLTPGGSAVDFTSNITAGTLKQAGALTGASVVDLLQTVWENGGIMESETATLMANGFNKRGLTREFITDNNYREQSRNVGGLNVQTIETDFGRLNVVLNRHVKHNVIHVLSLEEMKVCWLATEKGKFFAEPLAKVGAYERKQLYGEFGLRYGNEKKHGKIVGLTTR